MARHVVYDNSAFDGNDPVANQQDEEAIALDKWALLPGETATVANYTSYSRGLDGIIVDVANMAGTPTAADFQFKVGNDNNPGAWTSLTAMPEITVRPIEGFENSYRITLVWPDNVIQKQWLQVTVLATENTGLAEPDTFYFGNAIGEADNCAANAIVSTADEILARNFPHGPGDPATITDPYDFNRDRLVNTEDRLIARGNRTGLADALKLITAPVAEMVLEQVLGHEAETLGAGSPILDWCCEVDLGSGAEQEADRSDHTREGAVDVLLATYGSG
jgi:hypothetical protein